MRLRGKSKRKSSKHKHASPKEQGVDSGEEADTSVMSTQSNYKTGKRLKIKEPVPDAFIDPIQTTREYIKDKQPQELIRSMWELPAIAHFCSLFRDVFKLLDFDIEDLEEALLTDSATEESRSSLICDLLIALLKGLGKTTTNLISCNPNLYDLLENLWVKTGLGPNPLGTEKSLASFHKLPIHAKVILLHRMCEWRMERPDADAATKSLPSDQLRVMPLGRDDEGNTYWYFYGTRLYREEHEPLKLKINAQTFEMASSLNDVSLPNTSAASATPTSSPTKSKSTKKRKSFGGSSKKRKSQAKKSSPQKEKKLEEDEEESEHDEDQYDRLARNAQLTAARQLSQRDQLEGTLDTETLLSTMSRCSSPERSQLPAPQVEDDNSNMSFKNMVQRIYSQEDDKECKEEGNDSKDLSKTSELDTTVDSLDTTVNSESAADLKEEALDQDAQVKMEEQSLPPPYEQLDLCVDVERMGRWHLQCSTAADWDSLATQFQTRKSRQEKELHSMLVDDFIPSIEQLCRDKEREEQKKLLALEPRRVSDRLQVKQIRETEEEKLQRREQAERSLLEREENIKLGQREQLRQRRLEAGTREERSRLRQLDKQRQDKLRQRAREERERRVELRRQKAELIMLGKEIPPELLQEMGALEDADLSDSGANDDNELDIEIELEHTYEQLEKVLDTLNDDETSVPFREAVSEEIAPNYYDMIKKPMHLGLIESKLIEHEYGNKTQFIDDFNTILLNCLQYNGVDSDYTKLAQKLERSFIRAWKKSFPPAVILATSKTREEGLRCINKLGALDKKIRDILQEQQRDAAGSEEDDSDSLSGDVINAARHLPNTMSYRNQSKYNTGQSAGSSRTYSHKEANNSAAYNSIQRRAQQMHENTLANQQARSYSSQTSTALANAGNKQVLRVQPQTQPSSYMSASERATLHNAAATNRTNTRVNAPPFPMQRMPSLASSLPVPTTAPLAANTNPVYLLTGADGENRLFKFVLSTGQAAPQDMITQILPQIKRDVLQFPAGQLTTVKLDYKKTATPALAPAPIASGPTPTPSGNGTNTLIAPRPVAPATNQLSTPKAGPSTMPDLPQQQQHQQTVARPVTPTLQQLTDQLHALEDNETNEGASRSSHNANVKSYHLGEQTYVLLDEGVPWLAQGEQAQGPFVKLRRLDAHSLAEKLRQLKAKQMQMQNTQGASTSVSDQQHMSAPCNIQPIAGTSPSKQHSHVSPLDNPPQPSTVPQLLSPGAAGKPVCSVAPQRQMQLHNDMFMDTTDDHNQSINQ